MDPGRTLGQRYVIERELGRGGISIVFAGRDRVLEREVAIKLLGDPSRRHSLEPGLRREAKLVAGLDHPGIVPVFDFGRDQELLFLIMPLLHGRTLVEALAGGPLPIPCVAEIGRQVALALAHSHSHGIVHRSIKPANLMLINDGDELRVKIMDFGFASLSEHRREHQEVNDHPDPVARTLPYLSPEDARGDEVSPRSDLYALGAVLYEAVAGRPPFTGEREVMLEAIATTAPAEPHLLRSEIPRGLESLILALLAKEPARRPSNGREVAEQLEPYADAMSAGTLLDSVTLAPTGTPLTIEGNEPRTTILHDAVGRDESLRAIDSRLIAARAGALQLVLLSGEAGLGKTTVLDELAIACQQREIDLLRTRATADELGGWVGPFSELLTAGLAQRPEAADLLTKEATQLVALLPNLAHSRLGHLARMPKREASWAGLERVEGTGRPRLAGKRQDESKSRGKSRGKSKSKSKREHTEDLLVRAFAALVANGQPLTLAIDDAHLGGETVEFIDLLFRRLSRSPLVFVVAYEQSELGPQHPLSRLALRLAQHPRALSLVLAPLEEDMYSALMKQLVGGGQLEPGLAAQLFRQSGGYPRHARELVHAALEAGILVRRDNIWRLEAASWPVPRNLGALITSRLRRLPSALIGALQTASAIAVDGGSFNFDELIELTGSTTSELDHLLARAIERGLLKQHRSRGRVTLRFTSELLRRVTHAQLSPSARRKLHLHFAERLRRLPFSEEHTPRFQQTRLAHLIEGGAVAEAQPLVVERAQQALEDGRVDQALPQLTKLLGRSDSLAIVERAELLLLVAELENARGQTHTAVASLGRLASMLDQGDEAPLLRLGERGAELAKQLDRRSLADRLLGLRPRDRRGAERQRRARAELAALRPATSSRSMQIGDLLLMHREYTAAREAYDSARRRAASDGDRKEEARQLQKLARVASKLGHYETAIAYCREGFELLAGGHSLERVGLWALAAFTHCAAGYYDRAEAELEAGSAELATFPSQRSPDRDRVAAELERSRGDWLMNKGEAEGAIEAYERCLALNPSTDRWSVSVARFHLGQACALAGHANRALRELERAAADKRAIGDRWGLAYTQASRVQVLRDLGQIESAGETLNETHELADEVEDARLFALVHTELGRHALLSGKLELASQEARRAQDMVRRTGESKGLGAVYELLATIDLVRGEPAEARRHATLAVDAAEKHDLDGLLITALLVLAESSTPEQRPELLKRARAASEGFASPYRALDVSLTSLHLGLGDPNHAGDDYVALEHLSDRAEQLSAQRHVGLCLLAQAEVLAPHDLRGALDHARLGEAQLRVLGARLEADRAAELVARLTTQR